MKWLFFIFDQMLFKKLPKVSQCYVNEFFVSILSQYSWNKKDFFHIFEKPKQEKGVINLAVAGPQEFFKQHLIKNEKQLPLLKRYFAHFGKVSTNVAFCMSCFTPFIRVIQR